MQIWWRRTRPVAERFVRRAVAAAMIATVCIPGSAAASGGFAEPVIGRNVQDGPLPISIAQGPDGALWFTEVLQNAIGRLTPTGHLQQYPVALNGSLDHLAAGADGAMWFTSYEAPYVGRIDLKGSVRLFRIPRHSQAEMPIALGSDGAMWFTLIDENLVGRIAPDGSTRLLTLPHPSSQPFGITQGPDGAMWVAEASGRIARVATTGTVTEFAVTSPLSSPGIITSCRNALYFSTQAKNRVGVISLAGRVGVLPVAGQPYDLVCGHNGTVWYTRTDSDAVGRIGGAPIAIPPGASGIAGPLAAAGCDGALWLAAGMANSIERISPSGAVHSFPLPRPTGPLGISSGPDGAVWVTLRGANSIARVTTEGTVRLFHLPHPKSELAGITVGPDGALWFCERARDTVGRISLTGQMREFALWKGAAPEGITTVGAVLWIATHNGPTRLTTSGAVKRFQVQISTSDGPYDIGQLESITPGAGGSIWFSATGHAAIGTITASGTVHVFELPVPAGADSVLPDGISAAPNGTIWYADHGVNGLGSISPGGKVTTYRLSYRDGVPNSVVWGPDGALWYADNGADSIGRRAADGTIHQFSIPPDGATEGIGPVNIVVGPDSALWFTEYDAGRIGRIGMDGSIRQFTLPNA